jgi:hypothetical protein
VSGSYCGDCGRFVPVDVFWHYCTGPRRDSAAGDQKQDKAVPASLSPSVSNYIASLVAERDELAEALRNVLKVMPVCPQNTGIVGIEAKYNAAVVGARKALSAKEPT